MMKFLILFVLISITITISAQSDYEDVVYLKNGSVIRGIIIEQVLNQSVKIQIIGGSVLAYSFDEIEKLTKEPKYEEITSSDKSKRNFSIKPDLEPGYFGVTEIGYAFGDCANGANEMIKLNLVFGYRILPGFEIGIGTGLRYLIGIKHSFWYSEQEFGLPIFADFRAIFLNGKVSPYISFDIGNLWLFPDPFKSIGVLLNIAGGLNVKISNKSFISFGIGYDMQRQNSNNIGALCIHSGMSF